MNKPLCYDPEKTYELDDPEIAKHVAIPWTCEAAQETGDDWVWWTLNGQSFMSIADRVPGNAHINWSTERTYEVWTVTLTMRRKLGDDATSLAECIADVVEEHYKDDLRKIECHKPGGEHYIAAWSEAEGGLRYIFNDVKDRS